MPKVVMVMYDTLCRHYIPSYNDGNPDLPSAWIKAPNFERLAAKAVQFQVSLSRIAKQSRSRTRTRTYTHTHRERERERERERGETARDPRTCESLPVPSASPESAFLASSALAGGKKTPQPVVTTVSTSLHNLVGGILMQEVELRIGLPFLSVCVCVCLMQEVELRIGLPFLCVCVCVCVCV